jgi:alpha-ketoglutarate-dependent taurine dioxygenase
VQIWREMLPFVTSPEFAVDWKWSEGDAVLYDNRSLIHAASGFDAERFTREMWRTTILPPQPALEGGGDLLLSARL